MLLLFAAFAWLNILIKNILNKQNLKVILKQKNTTHKKISNPFGDIVREFFFFFRNPTSWNELDEFI